jgi:hypothetical protein
LIHGYFRSVQELLDSQKALFVLKAALDIGIFDILKSEELTLDEIFEKSSNLYHKTNLRRMLQALVAIEYLELQGERYRLAKSHELDNPASSERRYFEFYTSDWNVAAFRNLNAAIKKGDIPFEVANNMPLFCYLKENADASSIFNSAMTHDAEKRGRELSRLFHWQSIKSVCDVGGGRGTILRELLLAHPHLLGTLFDQEQVIAEAMHFLESKQINLQIGDFFKDLPVQSDAYILYHILHDWSDEDCRRILKNIKSQFSSNNQKLLIVERDYNINNIDTIFMDITMMALSSQGFERSVSQFSKLLTGLFTIQEIKRANNGHIVIICGIN